MIYAEWGHSDRCRKIHQRGVCRNDMGRISFTGVLRRLMLHPLFPRLAALESDPRQRRSTRVKMPTPVQCVGISSRRCSVERRAPVMAHEAPKIIRFLLLRRSPSFSSKCLCFYLSCGRVRGAKDWVQYPSPDALRCNMKCGDCRPRLLGKAEGDIGRSQLPYVG